MLRFKFSKRVKLFNKRWWNLTKAEWAPRLMSDNRELWPQQISAEGEPWKALSPSYRKWKVDNYGIDTILKLTGEMQNTASIVVRGNKFIVKTDDKGVYHQFGTSRMSARPWMGVPSKSLDRLPEISLKNILS